LALNRDPHVGSASCRFDHHSVQASDQHEPAAGHDLVPRVAAYGRSDPDNRKYGIENGNRILVAFGNILQGKIEKDEILGRQYGNRFVAIVRQKNLVKLLNVLKEIDVPFDDVNTDQKNHATLSARAGVYMIDRTDLAGEDILIFTGQALSAVKSKDNEDVVWLKQELIDAIAQRKKLESDIRTGIKAGEFKPYYQPKVNIDTGKLCGAEALSRWHHDGKVIFPGGYIPNMESNDTICLLDPTKRPLATFGRAISIQPIRSGSRRS